MADFLKRLASWASDKTEQYPEDPADAKLWDDLVAEGSTIEQWYSFDFTKLNKCR